MARRRRKNDPDDVRSIRLATRKDGTPVYKPYIYDRTRLSRKRWLGTFDELVDAQIKRDTAEAMPARSGQDLTIGQLIDVYLTFEGPDVPTDKTRRRYRTALAPLRAAFGRRYADEIGRPEARLWGSTQPVSVTDTARTLFNWAMSEDLAKRNPFGNLRRRRPRGRSDIQVLTEEELVTLANFAVSVWGAYGIVIRALIMLAAYTGMRAAELWGLRWRDIDMRAGVIHVRWQLETLGDERRKRRIQELRARGDAFEIVPGGLLTRPKNQEARTIVLFPEGAEALADLARHIDSDFVFLTIRDKLFSKSKYNHYWAPVRAAFAMSLPPTHWLRARMEAHEIKGDYHFHELRHLHASMLGDAEVSSPDNAQQLGHKDEGTLARYVHRQEDLARQRTRERWARRKASTSANESVASRLHPIDDIAD